MINYILIEIYRILFLKIQIHCKFSFFGSHAIGFEFEMMLVCFGAIDLIWFRLQTKKHFKAWSNISSKIWNKGTPNDCYRSEPSKWWYSINKNRAKNVLLLLLRYLLHMQFSSGGRRTSISNHRLFLVLCSFFIVFFLDIICVWDLTCRCRRIALQLEIFGLEEQVAHIHDSREFSLSNNNKK